MKYENKTKLLSITRGCHITDQITFHHKSTEGFTPDTTIFTMHITVYNAKAVAFKWHKRTEIGLDGLIDRTAIHPMKPDIWMSQIMTVCGQSESVVSTTLLSFLAKFFIKSLWYRKINKIGFFNVYFIFPPFSYHMCCRLWFVTNTSFNKNAGVTHFMT